ncbi:S-Ena type endospore appendage [Bacillus paramycoides]|uniref:Endospore appendages core domain-containing protein n=1 Tax=Bacillus paramycoides TaxID=2026194 RepID=A0A1J9U7Q9_9BACI|nr:S-Ena type endospore appendage [Bacillus paramycoides]OJD74832.1 hypothetical protein BAU28_18045 [Bacillus paramycoides]
MCDSQGINGNCCPPAKIFQEKICGNFSATTAEVTQTVWSAPAGDFFEGTFEIFNSATSAAPVTGTITSTPATPALTVPVGFSVSATALRPTAFSIAAPAGTNGKFCITLYKHVLA